MSDLTPEQLRALELFNELAALSPASDPTAIRISLRMPDGSYVGDALLSTDAVTALTDSTRSLNAYLGTHAPGDEDLDDLGLGGIDPLLYADFAEHTADLDVDGLLTAAASDPARAVALFDEHQRSVDGDAL